ncbi:hypothetical protein QJQ45_024146 [Haematococcus lacustris]|nr:hypothetical protein QJQ45_024146 [Haematococcus lacustris]
MGQKYGPRTGGRTLVPSGQVGVAPGKSAIDATNTECTDTWRGYRGIELNMRAVIQRVKSASVEVEGKIVSSVTVQIGPGLLCLVGLKTTDTAKDAAYITKKILKTRAFNGEGEDGRSWDKDVISCGYEVLLVSQFTLYGRLQKAKPDFTKAMSTAPAKEMWAAFVAQVQEAHKPELVKDGVFGAMMDVALVNDGPVTFLLDSETD